MVELDTWERGHVGSCSDGTARRCLERAIHVRIARRARTTAVVSTRHLVHHYRTPVIAADYLYRPPITCVVYQPPLPTPPTPNHSTGAAAFESARAQGIGILVPTKVGSEEPAPLPPSLPAATAYCVWPSSSLLARYLHSSGLAGALVGRSVLELGAGCGLPGFAAHLAGASRVCLTDLPINLPRLQQLVALNEAPPTVSVEALDWASPLPAALADRAWDLVSCPSSLEPRRPTPLADRQRAHSRAAHRRSSRRTASSGRTCSGRC